MGERTTDSLTSTGGINWEARSGFHERIKWKMEQKVKDQAKLISELKDDLIEALKTRDQEAEWVNLARDNVELRQKLAAGLTSYQAEIKRGDALLIERGDYAAEVLTLKADLAAMQTDAYHPLTIKVNHLEAVVRNLKAENADFQLVIEGQQKTINGQNETIRKWNDQILEDGEIIKKQKAEIRDLKDNNQTLLGRMVAAARRIRKQQDDLGERKDELAHSLRVCVTKDRELRDQATIIDAQARKIAKLEEIKLDNESIIKAWRPLIMAGA